MQPASSARVIGIQHRVKMTADGEARPTKLYVVEENEEPRILSLESENQELHWLRGHLATKWKEASLDNVVNMKTHKNQLHDYHQKWRELKKDEDPKAWPKRMLRKLKGHQPEVLVKVADESSFEGLRAGDTIVMCLGGSGDYFAYALAHKAEQLGHGTKVVRLPPHILERERGVRGAQKDDDAQLLVELYLLSPQLFYLCRTRDRDMIELRIKFRERILAMKDRIACEQRLRMQFIGQVFTDEGAYPNGELDEMFLNSLANSDLHKKMINDERVVERALIKAIEAMDIYQKIFGQVEGLGPMIAARIVSAVVDVRRFPNVSKFKAFVGAGLQQVDFHEKEKTMNPRKYGELLTAFGFTAEEAAEVGKVMVFARKRNNMVANWSNEARQGLYLFADQMNRRPDSVWGKKLREYKAKFRDKHPLVMCKCGKVYEDCEDKGKKGHTRKYTDMHIHKMAQWRAITKFTEWLFREWRRLESQVAFGVPVTEPADQTVAVA